GTFLSGTPTDYPILAATADMLGGLIAARLLSLAFMMGATACLYETTRRLFNSVSAFFAAAVFVALGPTQYLNVLATFDAMALFLLSLSTWLVVRARDSGHGPQLLVCAGVTITLANTAKYASGIFDPVIILLTLLVFLPQMGWKRAALAALGVTCVAATGD